MDAQQSPESFRLLLRRLRLAAGLSQEELAERAGLSPQAVSALERGVRRAPYRDTVELLATALNLTDQGRATLHTAVSRSRRPVTAPALPNPTPGNLPAPATGFIGREQEQRTVLRLLESTRLLTLTGTGGVGKTRLALQVAADFGTDGVRLVELAPLTDPVLVPGAAAQAIGLREQPGRLLRDTLTEALREQSLLLLLDNCEHLRAAAGALAELLLRTCPRLRILATSREALGAIGETVWWVPSLPVPDPDRPAGGPPRHTAESVIRAESAQLFCARAATAHPAFTLSDANAPAVAAICRRLDGIPLALELAAARARILTPEQIAARLDARFRLLTRGDEAVLPRHQTLRAALDWSYDLLTEPERRLLAQLSVFAGGCDLEAAEAVCGNEVEQDALVDLLHDLIEKSLLIVEYRGETARYRLLETVRQYARERLAASGELDATLHRYARWTLDLAEQAAPQMRGPEQATWIQRLDAEHDNLRAVLQWALDSDEVTLGLTLAAALYRFWFMRGHLTEGRGWLIRLLSRPDAAPRALHAEAVHITARLAMSQGDYDGATTGAQSALALYQDLEDDLGVARSLAALGQIAYFRGNFATAIAHAEETLTIARRIEDPHLTLMALSDLANSVQFQGDLDAALAYYEEAVAICRGLGDLGNVSILLGNVAIVTIRRGDYAAARPLVQEALALQRQIGGRNAVPRQLSWLAMIAREEGDLAGAGRHLEEALTIAHEIGDLDAVAGTEENLADLHRQAGDLSAAAAHASEAVRVASRLDDGKRHVTAILTSAKIAADLGRSQQAARLFGAAQTLQNAIGFVPFPNAAQEVDNSIATLRAVLGEPAFSELWFDGASMTIQQALAYALTAIPAELPAREHAGSPTISPER